MNDENIHFGRRTGPLHWFDYLVFVLMLSSLGVFVVALVHLKGLSR